MKTGQLLYDANFNAELLRLRHEAAKLLFRYNHLNPEQKEERHAILKKLLGKSGNECTILPNFHCDYGFNIEIGEYFFANVNLVILDGAKVSIGDHVFIAPNVGIYTAGHPLDAKQRRQGLEYALPVTIGNDVWIGGGSNILPGVTIGNNVVIGAGSVVTHDIPDNSLAFGNPCRVIRSFNPEFPG